jgi:hypothetical protein
MNWQKFFIAFVAAFVFIFIFEWIFHGIVLKETYAALPPGLMRPAEEFMKHFFHWLVLGQLVFVFFFTMIFASFAGRGGAGAGARYGILVALLGFGANLIQFAVHPLTTRVLGFWGIGGLIELAIAGAIIGAIYKPSLHTTT